MPPAWALAVAALLTIPGAYFIRLVLRPGLAHAVIYSRNALPWEYAKRAALRSMQAAATYRPMRRALVWLGVLPTWMGMSVVLFLALLVAALGSLVSDLCCPAAKQQVHTSKRVEANTKSAQPQTSSKQRQSHDTLPKAGPTKYANPLEEDPMASSALDAEIAALVGELGAVEAQLAAMGVPLLGKDEAGDKGQRETRWVDGEGAASCMPSQAGPWAPSDDGDAESRTDAAAQHPRRRHGAAAGVS
jgi:Na+-transporting methylmalonyl-CoA/oxaloacetate decarboxylase gamma subunit